MIEEKYLLLFANLKRKQLLNKVVVNPLPIFFDVIYPFYFIYLEMVRWMSFSCRWRSITFKSVLAKFFSFSRVPWFFF